MMISIIFTFFLLRLISAVPLPAVITRYHTAAAVTQTTTRTTGTTTVWLPPVGIYILPDGSSSTSTITDTQWNTFPVTFTSVVQKDVPLATQAAAITPALQPETTTTTEGVPTPAPAPQLETTSTTTTEAVPTPAPAPQSETTSTTTTDAAPTTAPATPATSTATSTSTTSTTTSTQTSTPSSTGDLLPHPSTIVYSPYANSGGCKSADDINYDLELIASKGIKKIRSYGTDCGSLTTVLSKCKQLGITVNQGVWMSEAGVNSVDDQIQQIINYGQQNGWDIFDLITIGNEAINSNFVTLDQLIPKLNSVKSQLRSSGYNGYVTTSEPPATFIKYPQLCTDSDIDIVGINPHSYFNTNISPENAGSYITSQQAQVLALCNGKSVWITETGYPSKGKTLGLNVPSPENQKIAVSSIMEATGGDVTILTTYNDFWKDPGPYGIEQYFGVIQLLA
ncbi:SCW11 [Candida oxycetoniae]|uniref:SCW11 n=1 Tax=Candida oxycetoniae TaxID=497107 RepID=A0AAI9WXC6_9ASCO|nr:SCW11 [Candida oxycetoniae]KAI3404171.1 SCW11 [Candida oxycetoniae]